MAKNIDILDYEVNCGHFGKLLGLVLGEWFGLLLNISTSCLSKLSLVIGKSVFVKEVLVGWLVGWLRHCENLRHCMITSVIRQSSSSDHFSTNRSYQRERGTGFELFRDF